jgi:hypothetical protein
VHEKLDALLQLLAQNLFVAVSAAHGGEEEAPARYTHVQAGDDRVREPTQSTVRTTSLPSGNALHEQILIFDVTLLGWRGVGLDAGFVQRLRTRRQLFFELC